jgi:hypothetical protein
LLNSIDETHRAQGRPTPSSFASAGRALVGQARRSSQFPLKSEEKRAGKARE